MIGGPATTVVVVSLEPTDPLDPGALDPGVVVAVVGARHDLPGVGGPDVEAALHPLRVGVLGRVDPAAGPGQVPGHVVDDPRGHVEVGGVLGDLPAVDVGPEQAGRKL